MKKNLCDFVVGLLVCVVACSFQIPGKTQDGRDVLLETDGTWKYCFAKKYFKSMLATKSVESKVLPLKISFNPHQWKIEPSRSDEEFFFVLKGQDAVAFLIPQVLSLSYEMTKETMEELASDVGDDFNMRLEEDRVVNGLPIKYFEYDLTIDGTPFTHMMYLYAGEEATIHFIAYGLKNEFDKHKYVMEDLLNGISFSR